MPVPSLCSSFPNSDSIATPWRGAASTVCLSTASCLNIKEFNAKPVANSSKTHVTFHVPVFLLLLATSLPDKHFSVLTTEFQVEETYIQGKS